MQTSVAKFGFAVEGDHVGNLKRPLSYFHEIICTKKINFVFLQLTRSVELLR